jgi:hypothetical protein
VAATLLEEKKAKTGFISVWPKRKMMIYREKSETITAFLKKSNM